MAPVQHLPPSASVDDVGAVLAADGCVVVDDLAAPEELERLEAELAPFMEATPYGDDFSGHHTRARTGGLIARSAVSHDLVMHPTVTGAVCSVLGHATAFQLHLTQIISIEPGQSAQYIHRDQWAFDFFSFPNGFEVTCNTIWAMTDFTAANGATRLIPGSHRLEDKLRFTEDDTEPAEMTKGSVLLYTGALYHGGGPNSSDAVRHGVNITYAVGWLRQEENQYLSVPAEIARDLPDDLLRMMGYAPGAYALGYVDDLRDPIAVLRGGGPQSSFDRQVSPPTPEQQMRDWGLVAPDALERIVVISPHLDDAVLGCGRLLATHPGATVITVYAGAPAIYPDPPTRWDTVAGFASGDDVLAARKEEDRAALAELGATPVWLDFVEHQYLERPDWVGAEQTVDGLEVAVRAADPTAVFMPFGLANPDHTETHDAARVVRERFTEPLWCCYQDMGYQHIPGLLAWRVAQLFKAGIWPTPVAPPVDHGDAAKAAAFARYVSQVKALEADWQLAAKLAAPAPEQFWRLAPPPEGWARLSETI